MFTRMIFGFVLLAGVNPALASSDSWNASWWTVDGGGEIRMVDLSGASEWEVSGTFGQWDSTDLDGSASGQWEVTGGFWSAGVAGTDFLFKDEFEGPGLSP